MKKYLFILTVLLSSALISCNDFDDNTEDQYLDYGFVTNTTSGITIKTDTDQTLYSTTSTGLTTPIGTRVRIVYTIVSKAPENSTYNTQIAISEISIIKTMDILTIDDAARDTLKETGIELTNIWIGGNYLNLAMGYYGSKTLYHNFYVGYDPKQQDKTGSIVLNLYHNTNKDTETYSILTIRSFNLSSVQWSGATPYKFIFRYKKIDSSIYTDVTGVFTPAK